MAYQFRIEQLLQHRRFLEALATQLTASANDREELVQETLAEAPPFL